MDIYRKKRSCSNERAAAISNLIAGMIVKDLRPINVVNGKGFQELMSYLEPGYKLPSDTHFTNLIEKIYASVKMKVIDILSKDVEFLSITADIWTSIATESYLSVTLHYIDNNWEIKSFALGTFPLTESHTGEV